MWTIQSYPDFGTNTEKATQTSRPFYICNEKGTPQKKLFLVARPLRGGGEL